MSLFTRQSGGHHTLAPSVTTVIANLSMIFSRQSTGALRHSQAPSCQTYSWCLQKPHSTGKSAQPSFIKSTVIVLHNRTLAWQDLSHAKSSLAVKGAWACYMPNNVLVVFAHIQLKSLYPLSYLWRHLWGNVPGPLLLFRTASNGKLGGARERG